MKSRSVIVVVLCVFGLSFASSQNLVVNGSFLQGTSGWDSLLIGGSAKAGYSIASGVYTFKISASGNESWNVQLKQRGIKLTQGDSYHFSFEASAASDREIEASVGMDNGPYTIYSGPPVTKFRLSTTNRKFDIYFRMDSASDSSARVQFNCGLAAINVNLTGVTIEKITSPMIKLLSPSGGETWAGGIQREIRWVGVGMQKVAISYSTDAGMSWTVVSDSAPNTGHCTWMVPGVASAWCLVRIIDAQNILIGDTCAGTFETGTFFNLVQNGIFSDSPGTGWDPLGVYGNAVAHGAITNGEYLITIDSGGTEPWHIQFTQSGVHLVNGESYVLSFDAYASAPRPLMINIGQSGGAYESYIDDSTRGKISLSTTPQTYSLEFTMSHASDSDARLEFNAGTSAALVHLDRVSLFHKPVVAIKRGPGLTAHGDHLGLRAMFRVAGVNRGYTLSLSGLPKQAVIIDLRGKTVRTLSPSGLSFFWDGRSGQGQRVGPGVYFIKVLEETGISVVPVIIPAR